MTLLAPKPAPSPRIVPAVRPAVPAVSVLMTVYNGSRFLRPAVESILNQTFDDLEFVIVDDGSVDDVLRTLRAFEKRDPRVRLFSRPHHGIVPAANFGLRQCRGEFVARMDADDVATPTRFEKQVELLRGRPEVTVVGGAYELVDAAGRLLRVEYPPLDDASLQELCLNGTTPICQPLAMMRRSAMTVAGEYDPAVETAEDLDMWLRLGEIGQLACVPDVLLQYRQHGGSVSETKQQAQGERVRIGVEKAIHRRGLERQFVAPAPWRPSGKAEAYRFLCQYGWWARKHAQRKTALIYGLKAIFKRPLTGEGWTLLLTSVLRPMPTPPAPPTPPTR